MTKAYITYIIAAVCTITLGWLGTQWHENAGLPATENVFVYGTLQSPAVRWFACRCITPATAATVEGYRVTTRNIIPDEDSHVDGYLLSVTKVERARFDRYERVPDRYQRHTIEVDSTPAWVYIRAD